MHFFSFILILSIQLFQSNVFVTVTYNFYFHSAFFVCFKLASLNEGLNKCSSILNILVQKGKIKCYVSLQFLLKFWPFYIFFIELWRQLLLALKFFFNLHFFHIENPSLEVKKNQVQKVKIVSLKSILF